MGVFTPSTMALQSLIFKGNFPDMPQESAVSENHKKITLPSYWKVLAILLSFMLLIIITVIIFFSPRQIVTIGSYHNEKIAVDEIQRSLRQWDSMATWYQALYIFLGVTAIGGSIFVASYAGDEKKKSLVRIMAVISTSFFTCISAFDLGGKSNDIRNAYRNLNAAVMTYAAVKDSTGTAITNLITAYRESENIIGSVSLTHTDMPAKDKTSSR